MTRRAIVVCALCLLSAPLGAQSSRLLVVLGDLHLSARVDAEQADALSHLLDALEASPASGVDVILNGDTFDLKDCVTPPVGDAAVEDLVSIMAIHRSTLDRLRQFARDEKRRVILLPGHCDAAILEEPLIAVIRERIDGVRVESDGRYESPDGRIVVEHGHGSIDETPALEQAYRVARTRFPIVGHFAERLSGLEYALSLDREAPIPTDLLMHFLLNVSWQQFRRDLELEVHPPKWNLGAIREHGDAFFLESIPADDPLAEAFHGASRRGELTLSLLSDDAVRAVCDFRAALRRARRRMERGLSQFARVGPVVAECPRLEDSRGPSFSYFWSARDARSRAYMESQSLTPDVYIHGHTHLPDRGFVPGVDLEGPRILDHGAFMKTMTPAGFVALGGTETSSIRELLETLQPEDLASCYSFVRVEPYEESPVAVQQFWRPSQDGGWESVRRCS